MIAATIGLTLTLTLAFGEHEGHAAPPAPERPAAAPAREPPGSIPAGYAEITVAPDRQQLIGVKVARAERLRLAGSVRATAVVEADETREAHVHSKLMGWVQELYVNAVGQRVRRGEPLYALYSQELFAAQQEYLRARRSSPELAVAARRRLALWDVPEDQILRVERDGAQRALVFRAPISGTVLEKAVLQGHYVEPGAMLYRIADLSRVWIIARIYEYEAERLDRRGTATVTLQGVAEPLHARVDHVYPTVDPASRTVKVRLVAPNDGRLRPGAYATAELPARAADVLSIPADAVIDTGVRQVVYLALDGGRFRPVTVDVGQRAAGRAEIRAGVREGDAVAVGAQFLLDSESRLRGVSAPTNHAGHGG